MRGEGAPTVVVGCPGIRDGIVECASIRDTDESGRAAPNDRPVTRPDERVPEASHRRAAERGGPPYVLHGIVASTGVEESISPGIATPDNHLVSRPDGGLALAPGGGAGRGCRCPTVGRAFPAAAGVSERERAGILATPNDHLVRDIDACENRGMRRARG